MSEPTVVIIAAALLLTGLIILKTIYFYRATRKRTLKRWFYFNQFHIVDASTDNIRRLRKWQNALSVILVILLLVSAVVVYFAVKGAV
jgi:uncharacterized membrane protein